ncbi:PilZ domain-containing protein [Thermodesulfobacteriota bacterium]
MKWGKRKPERRRADRYPVNLEAECTDSRDNAPKGCKVTDISREDFGVRLHIKGQVEVGDELQLVLHAPQRTPPVIFRVAACWIEQIMDDEGYEVMVGCKLVEIAPQDKHFLMEYAYQNWFKKV